MPQKQKQNIYEKIMTARTMFLQSNVEKSGYNGFKNFKYFELKDIVPVATRICNELKLYSHVSIADNQAVMTIINTEQTNETVQYCIEVPELKETNAGKALQSMGMCETYCRRYLYLLFLDIVENDIVDAADHKKNTNFKAAKEYKKSSQRKKSNERRWAERIIHECLKKDMLSAKMLLHKYHEQGDIGEVECPKILKELEVLLNGD